MELLLTVQGHLIKKYVRILQTKKEKIVKRQRFICTWEKVAIKHDLSTEHGESSSELGPSFCKKFTKSCEI